MTPILNDVYGKGPLVDVLLPEDLRCYLERTESDPNEAEKADKVDDSQTMDDDNDIQQRPTFTNPFQIPSNLQKTNAQLAESVESLGLFFIGINSKPFDMW